MPQGTAPVRKRTLLHVRIVMPSTLQITGDALDSRDCGFLCPPSLRRMHQPRGVPRLRVPLSSQPEANASAQRRQTPRTTKSGIKFSDVVANRPNRQESLPGSIHKTPSSSGRAKAIPTPGHNSSRSNHVQSINAHPGGDLVSSLETLQRLFHQINSAMQQFKMLFPTQSESIKQVG
ncbi:hypothetical protein QE152_g33642 [Popillia japonica]|uniref:Uncharacterized protein n=1 Tax=Popillia japonica TaxID=7064 RepID=A0AAW1IW84_POPJA